MIIDAHTHIGPSDTKFYTGDDLIKEMDEANVDYSVVLAHAENGKDSNLEQVLEAAKKNDRLKPIGDVRFDDLDIENINKLITLLDQNKIYGVKFYLGYDEYYPSNERLFPIYDYCQDNNKPVIFHTGALESGSRGLLKYSHPLNIDEVAHLYPKLKIIMAHMGNPWLLDCAAVMAKNENVYADMSGYFEENSEITHQEVAVFIQRLADAWLFLGTYEKFLFGSDFPLYSIKEYVDAVSSVKMSPREKELVFWKNANNLFNLKLRNNS